MCERLLHYNRLHIRGHCSQASEWLGQHKPVYVHFLLLFFMLLKTQ